jgi:hypothetical protein
VPFPFGPAWAEMAKAFLPTAAAPASKPAPKPPEVKAGEAGSDMLHQMLRTGAEVQGNNIRAMQELFETFWPSTGATAGAAPQGSPPASPPPDPASTKPRRGRPSGGTG